MNRQVKKIYNDIAKIKIQGATNVAIGVMDGIEAFIKSSKSTDLEKLLKDSIEVGEILANARPNEPLARNAVKYFNVEIEKISFQRRNNSATKSDHDIAKEEIIKTVSDIRYSFMSMLEHAKSDIVNQGTQFFSIENEFLTHCHSSTVENLFKSIHLVNSDIRVTATETRPLYQGRITTANLVQMGINTTMIVDDAVASYLLNYPAGRSVTSILIGCDEISANGDIVNKVGTYGIALAAKEAGKRIFVVTSLLKVNMAWKDGIHNKKIESRDVFEIWKDKPLKLKIHNPAFDAVPAQLFNGYLTEAGLISADDLKAMVRKRYGWLQN